MNLPEFPEVLFRHALAATLAGTVLAALIWGLQLACGRRLGPAWRHALWLVVLVRLLAPALPESRFSLFNAPRWLRPAEQPPGVSVTFPDDPGPFEALGPLADIPAPAMPAAAGAAPPLSLFRAAAVVWLLGAALLLGRLAVGSLWLRRRLQKSALAPDAGLLMALQEARAACPTRWNPRLVQTASIDAPGLFGCFRPRLLLPPGISARLSRGELRHVFLHELAHLRRGDLWTNLAMAVAGALHWFNPLVWMLLRQMRLERELACDAMALRAGRPEDRRSYGETILKLLEEVQPRSPLRTVVGIVEEKQSVRRRLAQVREFPGARKPARFLGGGLTALLVFFGLSNAHPSLDEPSAPTISNVTGGAVPPSSQETGLEALRREQLRQSAEVGRREHELNQLREQLQISPADEELDRGAGPAESPDNLERDRITAQARYLHFQTLAAELRKKHRRDLRKLIPTAAPDAAMDRYLADLARIEQQYAAGMNNFGPEHPEMMNLANAMKKIEQQIEDRIDGVLQGIELQAAQNKALVDALSSLDTGAGARKPGLAGYFAAKRELEAQRRVLETLTLRLLAEQQDVAQTAPAAIDHVRLIEDARLLTGLGQLDEAEKKLREVLKQDARNGAAIGQLRQIEAARSHRPALSRPGPERPPAPALRPDQNPDQARPIDEGAAPLYTRTFKLNPRAFRQNVENSAGQRLEEPAALMAAIRKLVLAAGASFPEIPASPAVEAGPPRKALFYNDQTGVLMARATLADLDIIETLLLTLNAAPPQVMIETHFVEIKPGAAYDQQLLLRAIATNREPSVGTLSGILTDPQFRAVVSALDGGKGAAPDPSKPTLTVADEAAFSPDGQRIEPIPALTGVLSEEDFRRLLEALRKTEGVTMLATPRVTTLSNRRARIAVEPGPVADLLPVVEDNGRIRLSAGVEWPERPGRAGPVQASGNAILADGETLVILPQAGAGPGIIIFVTPVIIDPAGNRVRPAMKRD